MSDKLMAIHMASEKIIVFLFWTCTAAFGISVITMQIIREKMFARILKTRSFALDNSWYTAAQKTTLKTQYIWGQQSKEMLCHGDLKNFVIGVRIASIIFCLSIAGIALTLNWIGGVP